MKKTNKKKQKSKQKKADYDSICVEPKKKQWLFVVETRIACKP